MLQRLAQIRSALFASFTSLHFWEKTKVPRPAIFHILRHAQTFFFYEKLSIKTTFL